MADELLLTHDDLFLLHRHYINLTCIDSGDAARATVGGAPLRYNFSAFVVVVDEVILAITAGHIFTALKKAVAAGAQLSDWAMDDSMVNDHGHPAYPIGIDLDRDVLYFDYQGLDYAAYVLDPMALIALKRSGIQPIEEARWDTHDLEAFPFLTLIGLPTQFSQLQARGPSIKQHVTVHVSRLSEPPLALAGQPHERIYARVDFESVAEWQRAFDIAGMSGGPVFGTRSAPQGKAYDYRLVGIQSSWDEKENVAICAAQPFLRALAEMFKSKRSAPPN